MAKLTVEVVMRTAGVSKEQAEKIVAEQNKKAVRRRTYIIAAMLTEEEARNVANRITPLTLKPRYAGYAKKEKSGKPANATGKA